MFCDLKIKNTIPKNVKAKKNNLALRIIPVLNKLEARLGISGSSIKPNQTSDKKNDKEKPKRIKILKINKYENCCRWNCREPIAWKLCRRKTKKNKNRT